MLAASYQYLEEAHRRVDVSGLLVQRGHFILHNAKGVGALIGDLDERGN